MHIKLHDKSTLHEIDWSTKQDGHYIRDYFTPILRNGAKYFIQNVNTKTYMLEVDHLLLPLTINDEEYENSYVCSPYTHYISYAKEELWELKNPLLEKLLLLPIQIMGHWFKRSQINKVVIVNNWFLSTNLYHQLTHKQLEQIALFLKEKFPAHAIMFRSLNRRLYPELFSRLSGLGFCPLFARSVYLCYPEKLQKMNRKSRKDLNNDRRLLRNSGYEILNQNALTEDEIKMVRKLYNQLYIEKYSEHNPIFTEEYYLNAFKHHLLEYRVLKKDGKIDGVIGFFTRDGILTTPILGYNTSLDKRKGLYRMLSYLILEEIVQNNYIGHFSAGAGRFKRSRGAEQENEYSFVYVQHLPKHRKHIWKILRFILQTIVEPLARKSGF
ncbi:hypothetical protein [Bacillus sp. OTU530]|uniref:hypothetical protein n=1 Tax=Bacillus sp. OTU530 TaxID=3043862 RepID=UPI00313AD947